MSINKLLADNVPEMTSDQRLSLLATIPMTKSEIVWYKNQIENHKINPHPNMVLDMVKDSFEAEAFVLWCIEYIGVPFQPHKPFQNYRKNNKPMFNDIYCDQLAIQMKKSTTFFNNVNKWCDQERKNEQS